MRIPLRIPSFFQILRKVSDKSESAGSESSDEASDSKYSISDDEYRQGRQYSVSVHQENLAINQESKEQQPSSLVNQFSFSKTPANPTQLQELVEKNDWGRINRKDFMPNSIIQLLPMAITVPNISPKTVEALLEKLKLEKCTPLNQKKLRELIKQKSSEPSTLKKQQILEKFLNPQNSYNYSK